MSNIFDGIFDKHHDGDWDGDDDEYPRARAYIPRPPPRCHQCKAVCCWYQIKGKWVLHSFGKPHVCPPQDNTPEGFE